MHEILSLSKLFKWYVAALTPVLRIESGVQKRLVYIPPLSSSDFKTFKKIIKSSERPLQTKTKLSTTVGRPVNNNYHPTAAASPCINLPALVKLVQHRTAGSPLLTRSLWK